MRLRNIPGAREAVEASPYCVQNAVSQKGRWRALFPGRKGLYLEIGSGKGGFLIETAKKRPQDAFLGMERYSTVLFSALKKLAAEQNIPDNLLFVQMDAFLVETVFDPGEIDGIFLNFSDPWPKERHRDRRLVSAAYLRRFARVLRDGAEISFKTDNRALFDFALEEAPVAGYVILEQTYDLHADETLSAENVMTEYEKRFSEAGHPICKYVIQKGG